MARIVVIGAGYGGATCASNLEKLLPNAEITVVEGRDSMVHKFGGARAAAYGSKFSYKVLVPNDALLIRGQVIRAKAQTVTQDKVLLQDGRTLEFDYLVCATGSRNNFGEPPMDLTKAGDMKSYYDNISEAVEKAKRILVVGGGPVGVEMTGEILDRYKDKEITVIEAKNTLIPNDPAFPKKFVQRLQKILETKGVKVILGTRAEGITLDGNPIIEGEQNIKLSNSETVECDLVLLTVGTTLSTGIYPEVWLNEQKRIKVLKTLQVEDFENIFAVGDINDMPETKMGAFAMEQGKLVAKNIAKLVSNKSAKLKEYKAHSPLMIVPVGRSAGASQLGPFTAGSWITSQIKGKGVFLSITWKLMNQSKNIPK